MHKYEYDFSLLGQRVFLAEIPSWLTKPKSFGQLLLEKGWTGKIIGSTASKDKIAVEFDNPIWITSNASIIVSNTHYSTDCNGKGKPGYCAYFWPIQVQLFSSNPSKKDLLTVPDRKLLLLKRK